MCQLQEPEENEGENAAFFRLWGVRSREEEEMLEVDLSPEDFEHKTNSWLSWVWVKR